MNARSVLVWGFALVTAPLVPACVTRSPDDSSPTESSDGAAPDGASGGGDDAGGAMSSDGSSSGGDADSAVTEKDSGSTHEDSGGADGSVARDAGCIRPPYQTTDECTGIGMPGGPVIPSCSIFNASDQLVCPTIPGCTVVPGPSGDYCTGDNVTCGLSDCGHICILPNWDPCFDVATGVCLEGC